MEDSMSVEEIIFVEKGLPRCIGARERCVGINHEDGIFIFICPGGDLLR